MITHTHLYRSKQVDRPCKEIQEEQHSAVRFSSPLVGSVAVQHTADDAIAASSQRKKEEEEDPNKGKLFRAVHLADPSLVFATKHTQRRNYFSPPQPNPVGAPLSPASQKDIKTEKNPQKIK